MITAGIRRFLFLLLLLYKHRFLPLCSPHQFPNPLPNLSAHQHFRSALPQEPSTAISDTQASVDIDSTNHKCRSYNAPLPARLQVDAVGRAMSTLSHDMRQWPAGPRREIALSDVVTIVNQKDEVISVAPKLALVVVSSVFRDYFDANPGAKGYKIPAIIDDEAFKALVEWLTSITRGGDKFGVALPTSNMDLIKVRHAAHTLGMEQYVRHFCRAYKDHLRRRTPLMDECELVERLALEPVDDLLVALGERLAYLRRRGEFNEEFIAMLAEFMKVHPKLARAVFAADERSARARAF